MNIDVKDLYQLLIAECRYGYTRNNHLMPDGAYDHAKKYLPLMLTEDKDYALNTAKQLCDECISEQLVKFSDGLDDENGSRTAAFKFIEDMIAFIRKWNTQTWEDCVSDWVPYNYDNYLRNKALDDELLYNIYESSYEVEDNTFGLDRNFFGLITSNKVNKEKLSKNTVADYLFREILKVDEIDYRRWNIDKYTTKYVFDDLRKVYYIRREQND